MAAPSSLPGQLLLDALPRTRVMTMQQWEVCDAMGMINRALPFAVTGCVPTAGEAFHHGLLRRAFLLREPMSFLPEQYKAPHCRPTKTRQYGYEMTMSLL